MGTIEADGRMGADAGAAGRLDCVDIGSFCDVAGCRSVDSSRIILSETTNNRDKLDSAFLLQHGKRILELFNNLSKGQGVLVFVAIADVSVQTFGEERLKKMKASAFMFFNCCQRSGETCTSKATPIMIWRKERCRPAVDPTPFTVLTICNGIPKIAKGS